MLRAEKFSMLNTLRGRLLAILILVSFLPALLLGGILSLRSQNVIGQQAQGQLSLLAKEKKDSIGIELHSLQIIVETLAQAPSVKNKDKDAVQKFFSSLLSSKNGIDAAFLIGSDGISNINTSEKIGRAHV